MPYVIAEPCIGTCDTACVEVCPVDCIHGPFDPEGKGEEAADLDTRIGFQLFINPDECIDCGACEPECPVSAIFEESELPEEWAHFAEINRKFFTSGVEVYRERELPPESIEELKKHYPDWK